MTDKQIIRHFQSVNKINLRDLKLLDGLKLKIDAALDAQRHGHTDKWHAVQKQIDRIDDKMDCEALAKGDL